MDAVRLITHVYPSTPTLEGAGVHLKRAIIYQHMPQLDPFLLLDDFRSKNPADYIKGFPWHPHRGIETITYILEGKVEHGDSLGNLGVIGPGDVQWMTAGSGIIHQEMPKGDEAGHMGGFQLWANLPAANKMMEPRYRDVKSSQIPVVNLENGGQVRLVAGTVDGVRGPVQDVVTDPEYLDVSLPAGASFEHLVTAGHSAFAYVFQGAGRFAPGAESEVQSENLVIFGDGTAVQITAGASGVRFLFASGQPIGEPVAWYGPIVMNTREELQTAFKELQNDTFLKHAPPAK